MIGPAAIVVGTLLSGSAGARTDSGRGRTTFLDKSLQLKSISDAELAQRAARGDRAAFHGIYERYAERLWREVIWPIARNDARAEDALCETFLSALQAIGRFRPDDEGRGLLAWLKQIARRKALDQHRGDRRGENLQDRIQARGEPAPEPRSPDSEILAREEAHLASDRVAQVFASINPRYAEALRLRLQEGRPRAECAQTLGIRVSTFDVVLYRAVRAFRQAYLERYGSAPEEEL